MEHLVLGSPAPSSTSTIPTLTSSRSGSSFKASTRKYIIHFLLLPYPDFWPLESFTKSNHFKDVHPLEAPIKFVKALRGTRDTGNGARTLRRRAAETGGGGKSASKKTKVVPPPSHETINYFLFFHLLCAVSFSFYSSTDFIFSVLSL